MGVQLQRNLSGTFARRDPNSIVWLGDSITGNGDAITGATGLANISTHPRGFWCWTQTLTGHRLRTLANAGISGQRTDEILARIPSDVVARKPGWCHTVAGTNDIGQAVPLATVKANLTAIWNALDAAGCRVIAGTIPPRSSYTGTQKVDGEALNLWIRDQGRTRPNLHVVDYYAALVDTGSTGSYASDATFDGTHPTTIGAARMGALLADTINTLVPAHPPLSSAEGDSTNLIGPARFNTGGNGAVPTGWSSLLTGSAFSKTARTDKVNGSWQTVTVANGASGYLQRNVTVDGTTLAVGDTVIGAVEYQLSALDTAAAVRTQAFYLEIQSYNGTTASAIMEDLYWIPATSENMPAWSRSGVLRTPPVAVPVGTTQVLFLIRMYGGGTYNLDRATLTNVTKTGLSG